MTTTGISLAQCKTHGVSIDGLCCDHSVPLGYYGPTERVRCAKCEESIRDPRFGKYDGREFDATSTDGAVCRWCSLHDHPADFDCTSSCPGRILWSPSPAVTDAQRDDSLRAAHETIAQVRTALNGPRTLWTSEALGAEIHKLMAALGHLTIAES